jgi:hypothetical protein
MFEDIFYGASSMLVLIFWSMLALIIITGARWARRR